MEKTYIEEKVKYDFLVNYLKMLIKEERYLDREELNKILIALELEDETNE